MAIDLKLMLIYDILKDDLDIIPNTDNSFIRNSRNTYRVVGIDDFSSSPRDYTYLLTVERLEL